MGKSYPILVVVFIFAGASVAATTLAIASLEDVFLKAFGVVLMLALLIGSLRAISAKHLVTRILALAAGSIYLWGNLNLMSSHYDCGFLERRVCRTTSLTKQLAAAAVLGFLLSHIILWTHHHRTVQSSH